MKKIILFSLVAVLMAACSVDDKYYGESNTELFDMPYNIDWYEAADSATNLVLIDKHWVNEDEKCGWGNWYWFFHIRSGKGDDVDPYNYWPQAHCIDVVVDAYLRTKSETNKAFYLDLMDKWFKGIPQYQWGSGHQASTIQNTYRTYNGTEVGVDLPYKLWYNNFIDDMEWIALAQIRMWEATGIEEYLTTARYLYDNYIINAWRVDENFGGVRWSFEGEGLNNSKNACSNGPASVLAAKFYNITKEQKYLDDAIMIYDWIRWALYEPETGGINDNMVYGKIPEPGPKRYYTTYNQGTFMGTAHLLWHITGDDNYRREMLKAANYVIDRMGSGGLMPSAHTNDLGMFNGIYVRYLVPMINDPKLDKKTRERFKTYLTNQAITLWTKGIDKTDNEYGMLFTGNFEIPGFVTTLQAYNYCGAAILEAMNQIQPIN